VTAKPTQSIAHSASIMTEIVLPEDTNHRGTVFGGRVLALIDKCAAIVAIRHSRSECVTAHIDSVQFLTKVRLGNVLIFCGRLNAAFGSSMEIEVEVRSEDPLSGKRKLTTTAFVTMVAIDGDGEPKEVPRLELGSDEERKRADAAKERRRQRLASRRPRRSG
jgi:acyl-CoA hydrolase